MDELNGLDEIARDRELELLKPARADLLAQRHHAALTCRGPLSNLSHRHVHDVARVIEDEAGDPRRCRRQSGLDGAQTVKNAREGYNTFYRTRVRPCAPAHADAPAVQTGARSRISGPSGYSGLT